MGVGAGLYMCDAVKKVHVLYLISWWVIVKTFVTIFTFFTFLLFSSCCLCCTGIYVCCIIYIFLSLPYGEYSWLLFIRFASGL